MSGGTERLARRCTAVLVAAGAGLLLGQGAMAWHVTGIAPPAAVQRAALPSQEVAIDGFAFAPRTLTVKAGTEVVWVNRDDEPHTIVLGGGQRLAKSPPLDTDDRFAFVMREPGTYPYYCSVHPHMTGTIVVE
jgi:plastocyanin